MPKQKTATRIKPFRLWSTTAQHLLDSASIALGLWITLTWLPLANSKSTIVVTLLAIGLYNFTAQLLGLYRDWQAVTFDREALCTIATWFVTLLGLSFLGGFTEYSTEIASTSLFAWGTTTPLLMVGFRSVLRGYLRWISSCSRRSRGFAVVGTNKLGIDLVHNIAECPELGFRFLGFFDDRPQERTEELPEEIATHLGPIAELVEQARRGDVQVVFITLPLRAEARIHDIIKLLADTTASVYVVPDLFAFQLLHARWTNIRGIPVVSVYESPLYGVDGVLKRSFDVAIACAALLFLAIPMLCVAAAVKLTSPGPIFFRQKRYGLDGQEILVWKFRSMHTMENGPTVKQATKNDPRLTPIGGFLRSSSLDELPQLFNVLEGSMSLVGPRPHATAHNEEYRTQIEGYMLRHKIKPGITGLAQVNGCRGETEDLSQMEDRVHYDHKYIREWNLWLDFKILLQTFSVVLSRKQAY